MTVRVVRTENKSIEYNNMWKLENITLKYNLLSTLVAAMNIELNAKDENIEEDEKKKQNTKHKMIVINNMNKW